MLAGDARGPAGGGARREVPATDVRLAAPVVAVPFLGRTRRGRDTAGGLRRCDRSVAARARSKSGIRAPSRSAPAEARAKSPAPTTPADDVKVVLAVRSALRGGDCDAALRLLDEAAANGARLLAEERDVLMVEALACSGRADEARSRALAFLAAHPRSMHEGAMQRIAVGSPGAEGCNRAGR